MSNSENFKDIPKELLAQGKSVIDNHPKIANGQYYIITPERKAFFIRVEYKENVRERELTPDEYRIAGIFIREATTT